MTREDVISNVLANYGKYGIERDVYKRQGVQWKTLPVPLLQIICSAFEFWANRQFKCFRRRGNAIKGEKWLNEPLNALWNYDTV